MYKHSPARNQRFKGFKVNQVLQICVLVAACIWLIYQVNHSHDKKKDFEEADAISLPDTNSHDLKIGGRKGLHDTLEKEPLIKEKNVEEETEEENEVEEDDSKHEENVEDFENKHEEDEQEQEKSETENEHDVDILDEERDREEVDDSEDKEAKKEDENYVEDHDHEAREKHYKGDDASSAVTHESESVSAKTEKRNPENIIKKMEANSLEDEKLANISGFIVDNNATGEIAGNVISLNTTTTTGKKKSENVSSKQKEIPVSSSTMTAKFDINQEETGNDLAKKRKPTNDILVMNSTEAKQSVDQGDISMKPSLNKTQPHSNSVDVQNAETVQRETSNPSITSKTVESENKKTDVKAQENRNDNLELGKKMAYSYTEEGGVDHHDPIDDSDTTISLEKDVRTDTDNLRDIRTKGSNDKKAALE